MSNPLPYLVRMLLFLAAVAVLSRIVHELGTRMSTRITDCLSKDLASEAGRALAAGG